MNRPQLPVEWPSTAVYAAGRIDVLRVLAWTMGVSSLAVVFALFVTPWQQSVRGAGRVIAFAPLDRQQTLEAPIDGRVAEWFVQEGQRVDKGQALARLADNDPEILQRLRQERDSSLTQIRTIDQSIALTEMRVSSMGEARTAAVENARLKARGSRNYLAAAEQAVMAAEATERTAALNLRRVQGLHTKGLVSRRDLELAELDFENGRAGLEKARSGRRAAAAEAQALDADLNRIDSTNQASIAGTGSSLEKLRGDRAKAEAELAKVEVRLARQHTMEVTAPRSGTVLRLLGNEGNEMVKAGDPLLVLVPESASSAVELTVDGNDAPLIDPDRPVRLQFEGWPAVQFVGWPSVAVGTFAGRVAFMDSHDDGNGGFRIVVVPTSEEPWPDARYLRQGVRANGWVLLNQVSLGFELWRQFNGFPPAIAPPKSGDKSDSKKKGGLG